MSTQSLVKNNALFNQPLLFDGVQSDKIYPSDIDSFIELWNKYLILIEVKTKGKDITLGQNIAMTRIIQSWEADKNKIGMVLHVYHSEYDSSKPIMLKDCIVNKVYTKGKWNNMKNNLSVKEFLIMFGNKFNINPFKNFNS